MVYICGKYICGACADPAVCHNAGMIVLDTYTEQTGISEHILLALLAVRIPAIGMGGRLYQALEALSAWAFSAAAAKLSCAVGLKQFGEVTQLLSAVLTTYRWVTYAVMLQLQLS